jgi:hypothetical protein
MRPPDAPPDCSLAAAVALRDTLDRDLLLAAETKGGKQ